MYRHRSDWLRAGKPRWKPPRLRGERNFGVYEKGTSDFSSTAQTDYKDLKGGLISPKRISTIIWCSQDCKYYSRTIGKICSHFSLWHGSNVLQRCGNQGCDPLLSAFVIISSYGKLFCDCCEYKYLPSHSNWETEEDYIIALCQDFYTDVHVAVGDEGTAVWKSF